MVHFPCSSLFFFLFFSAVLFSVQFFCLMFSSVLLFLSLFCALFCSAVICSVLQVQYYCLQCTEIEILRLSALCTYIELQLPRAALSLGPGQTALKVWLILLLLINYILNSLLWTYRDSPNGHFLKAYIRHFFCVENCFHTPSLLLVFCFKKLFACTAVLKRAKAIFLRFCPLSFSAESNLSCSAN